MTRSEIIFQEGIVRSQVKCQCQWLRFLNLSGKVAKKNDSGTEKRSPRPQCVPPLAIAAYEICHGVTEHG